MARKNRQVAFLFNEAANLTTERIGGKAKSLVTMAGMGMPVPPGFAVSTGVCRAYLEHARYPGRLEWHIRRCLSALEKQTGKRFGDPSNPLLVSVRSGAPVSMPGMMDTVLNLGITPEALPALEKLGGTMFAVDTHNRFRTSFGKVVGSKVDNPWEQLELAFEAICQSWLNDRAVDYRRVHNISEDMGTAMIVQAMVFGNLDHKSGTGVVFSRNVATGDPEIYGEFLPEAQGEDVVGGSVTPLPISFFAEMYPEAFKQLTDTLRILEAREKDVVEIEFTVEAGKLWTLQYRVAKRTPIAAARFAVQSVWGKQISKVQAIARVGEAEIDKIRCLEFDPRDIVHAKVCNAVLGSGLSASPGAAVGIAIFSSSRAKELAATGKTVVLIRPETHPDDFAGMLVAAAIVTEQGGTTSHAAVVARGLGKPAVVGVGKSLDVMEGALVSVDGSRGLVISDEMPFVQGKHHKEVSIFLKWYEEARPKGNWDFAATQCQYSANVILNDFYLSDEMARLVQGTEWEREAKDLRNRVHHCAAEIFAAYLLLAISGELRHGWDTGFEREGWKSPEFEVLHQKFGLLSLATSIDRRFDAQISVVEKLNSLDRKDKIEFLRLAVVAFNTWSGGSIGGPKWAVIAEAVQGYLEGTLNHSVFVDRVFDLRHNSGVLFNKHPMFSTLTVERSSGIQSQLDIKRRVNTIDSLVTGLAALAGGYSEFIRTGLSPYVSSLWQKGIGKYWQEPVQPSTRW